MSDTNRNETQVDRHQAARPLEYVEDQKGDGWLCDKGVDVEGDLKAQGCWRCDEIAFPYGGR